jgi:hypothetical protein
MRITAILLTAACAAAIPAAAQGRFTGFVGGGFTEPVKDIGTRLDRGWNATAGAGVNLTDHVGVLVDFGFNNFDINRSSLNQVGAPGGTTRIWSLTLDPIVHLAGSEAPVDIYVTGGGGVYHRTVEFTAPSIATVTAFDPWWGVFYPANVPSNVVIGSYSVTKPGANGGLGVSFRLGSSRAKIFAEARYHRMFTNRIDTTYVPVTFGLRW